MRSTFGWFLVCLMACTSAGTPRDPEPTPATPPAATPETPPVAAPETPPATTPETPPATPTPAPAVSVTVQMTAATLADACGGPAKQTEQKAKMKQSASRMRSCDDSSMQLSIAATTGDTATRISVKKVELLDDKGAMLGELTASTPTAWDQGGTYAPWNESVAPGQELSVSYALSQPPWGKVADRWNRTFVVRAVITVGSGEQSVQRDVYVAAPTTLPPGVKT